MKNLHNKLKSKIFLDGGDPQETRKTFEMLGFLDGQTTNPSLIVKNPDVCAKKEKGESLTEEEALSYYKEIITSIAKTTNGPVSIQVFANEETTAEEMLEQARERIAWIPNGLIKFPCTYAGVFAASQFCEEGPVNMTLVFTQNQAAAVYQATKQTKHPIFISPFVGRLDDRGENGMDVIKNILRMFAEKADEPHRVSVLTASIRNLDHLLYALQLKSPATTSPFKILKAWNDEGCKTPGKSYKYDTKDLKEIPYIDLSLDKDWKKYDLHHPLTDAGLARFWDDWQGLLK